MFGMIILGGASISVAQVETKSAFDDSALPRTAGSAAKFVPSGWTIEETITGDLNGDLAADTALVLIEKPTADENESRERVLMILFKNAKGGFDRAATAKSLLQCTQCGGMLGGNNSSSDIKIIKGVLTVNTLSGSRESSETTFRFRYDSKAAKFVLIGYDSIERDRATGVSTVQSTNFITGAQVTEEFQYSQKLDKDVKKSTKRVKVSKPPYYFEDINYETFGSDF